MRWRMESDVRIHLNKGALVRGTQGSVPCRWEVERSGGSLLPCLPSLPHHSYSSGLIIHICVSSHFSTVSVHNDSCHCAVRCSWQPGVQITHLL